MMTGFPFLTGVALIALLFWMGLSVSYLKDPGISSRLSFWAVVWVAWLFAVEAVCMYVNAQIVGRIRLSASSMISPQVIEINLLVLWLSFLFMSGAYFASRRQLGRIVRFLWVNALVMIALWCVGHAAINLSPEGNLLLDSSHSFLLTDGLLILGMAFGVFALLGSALKRVTSGMGRG